MKTTVGSVIEKLPLNQVHYWTVVVAALGFMFDSFDTYIVSYAMPSIIQEWNITPVENGMLTSMGFWGMFVGAIILSSLGNFLTTRSVVVMPLS